MSVRVLVGAVEAIAHGTARLVKLPHAASRRPEEAIIVRDAFGRLRAYRNRCRHLPIPIDGAGGEVLSADGEHLECRTHGALYQLHDGLCIAGPCEGLSLFPIAVEEQDGELYLIIEG